MIKYIHIKWCFPHAVNNYVICTDFAVGHQSCVTNSHASTLQLSIVLMKTLLMRNENQKLQLANFRNLPPTFWRRYGSCRNAVRLWRLRGVGAAPGGGCYVTGLCGTKQSASPPTVRHLTCSELGMNILGKRRKEFNKLVRYINIVCLYCNDSV